MRKHKGRERSREPGPAALDEEDVEDVRLAGKVARGGGRVLRVRLQHGVVGCGPRLGESAEMTVPKTRTAGNTARTRRSRRVGRKGDVRRVDVEVVASRGAMVSSFSEDASLAARRVVTIGAEYGKRSIRDNSESLGERKLRVSRVEVRDELAERVACHVFGPS